MLPHRKKYVTEFMNRGTKRPQSAAWHKLKIALSIFLPLAVLINTVLWIFYYQEVKTRKNILETHEVNMTDMQSVKIGINFSLIVSDLMFFAGYNQLLDALENAESGKMRLIDDFALFSRRSKIYDQIRIIDTTGMEIIRIDFSKRGPVIVPEDRLQFKGDRYYFKDTFEIEKGEIFVSPFDLNIEHGVIEKPLKPMIRFGAPVFDRQGQKRGIVIFNYLGANLIRDIKDVIVDSPGFYMLLNADGYWIIGRDAGDEWGFMYEDRKDRTMKNTYPAVWEKISAIESGQFYDAEGLFTFTTVYPLFEGWKSSTGAGEAFAPSEKIKEAKEYYWKVVSYIPKNILIEGTSKSLSKYIYIGLMIVLLLGTGTWRLASAKVKHDIDEWELVKRSDELEDRVEERTAEMAEINEILRDEIVQRRKTEEELEKHRTHLEEMVKERTAELQEKNRKLENFNKLFIDREFRIKELRERIAELEGKLNIDN